MTLFYNFVLHKALPGVYVVDGEQQIVPLHPYVPQALLLVALTTLVLFFASGLYSEKIGYANRYENVPWVMTSWPEIDNGWIIRFFSDMFRMQIKPCEASTCISTSGTSLSELGFYRK